VVIVMRILLIAVLFLASAAGSARADRWWVELPRSGSASFEDPSLPWPPVPGPRALQRRLRKGRPDVVAILQRGPDPVALRQVQDLGARIHRISRWMSAVSIEADAGTIRALRESFGSAALHRVRVAVGRRELDEVPVILAPRRAPPVVWGEAWPQLRLSQIDSMQVLGFDGSGLRILVLDTGFFRDLPVFGGLEVIAERDFVQGDDDTANDPGEPAGQHFHGTAVLSALGGSDPGIMMGAAPGAEFLLAKTEWVATETRVEEDNFVAALEWGEALGADIATASLLYFSFPDEPDAFSYATEDLDGDTAVTTRAFDDLAALGVVCISAAGNAGFGTTTIGSPADADSSLAIAATDSFGVLASFSSRGPSADGRIKPDLAAMGQQVLIVSTDGSYARANGTSLSAPLVAGTVALVMQAHPEWGLGELQSVLRATATQSATPDYDMGWGIVRGVEATFAVVEPPYPLPFTLISPPDSAVVFGPVEFQWHVARDLQTPQSVGYQIELSATRDFADVLAVYTAFTDTTRTLEFLPSGPVRWRVVATDPDGNARSTRSRAVQLDSMTGTPGFSTSAEFRVAAIRPNPARGPVRVFLELGRAGMVQMQVYDLRGRRVREWAMSGESTAGEHVLVWDGRDSSGRGVANGVYVFRASLLLGDGRMTRDSGRFTLLR
jgi:subtilisin family serine protease